MSIDLGCATSFCSSIYIERSSINIQSRVPLLPFHVNAKSTINATPTDATLQCIWYNVMVSFFPLFALSIFTVS